MYVHASPTRASVFDTNLDNLFCLTSWSGVWITHKFNFTIHCFQVAVKKESSFPYLTCLSWHIRNRSEERMRLRACPRSVQLSSVWHAHTAHPHWLLCSKWYFTFNRFPLSSKHALGRNDFLKIVTRRRSDIRVNFVMRVLTVCLMSAFLNKSQWLSPSGYSERSQH